MSSSALGAVSQPLLLQSINNPTDSDKKQSEKTFSNFNVSEKNPDNFIHSVEPMASDVTLMTSSVSPMDSDVPPKTPSAPDPSEPLEAVPMFALPPHSARDTNPTITNSETCTLTMDQPSTQSPNREVTIWGRFCKVLNNNPPLKYIACTALTVATVATLGGIGYFAYTYLNNSPSDSSPSDSSPPTDLSGGSDHDMSTVNSDITVNGLDTKTNNAPEKMHILAKCLPILPDNSFIQNNIKAENVYHSRLSDTAMQLTNAVESIMKNRVFQSESVRDEMLNWNSYPTFEISNNNFDREKLNNKALEYSNNFYESISKQNKNLPHLITDFVKEIILNPDATNINIIQNSILENNLLAIYNLLRYDYEFRKEVIAIPKYVYFPPKADSILAPITSAISAINNSYDIMKIYIDFESKILEAKNRLSILEMCSTSNEKQQLQTAIQHAEEKITLFKDKLTTYLKALSTIDFTDKKNIKYGAVNVINVRDSCKFSVDGDYNCTGFSNKQAVKDAFRSYIEKGDGFGLSENHFYKKVIQSQTDAQKEVDKLKNVMEENNAFNIANTIIEQIDSDNLDLII